MFMLFVISELFILLSFSFSLSFALLFYFSLSFFLFLSLSLSYLFSPLISSSSSVQYCNIFVAYMYNFKPCSSIWICESSFDYMYSIFICQMTEMVCKFVWYFSMRSLFPKAKETSNSKSQDRFLNIYMY